MKQQMTGIYSAPKKHPNPAQRRAAFIQDYVENPYAGLPKKGQAKGQERVYRRTSDNPLLTLLARQYIDQAQFIAAQKYLNAHLISTGQSGQAMDYTRQRVDGGNAALTLTEKQVQASDVLRQANRELKANGVNEKSPMEAVLRVQKIVGEGFSVTQYCQVIRGLKSSKSVSKQMKCLREDLTVLAQFWNLQV